MFRKNLLMVAAIATASLFNLANAYELKKKFGSNFDALSSLLVSEISWVGEPSRDNTFVLEFAASTLGDGAMFLDLTLVGAKFNRALVGTDLTGCLATAGVVKNISSGGKKDDTTVRFRIEKAGGCAGKTGVAAMLVKIPVVGFVGGTDVTVATNLTDANVDNPSPIDGGVPSNINPYKLYEFIDTYQVEVTPPTAGKTVTALLDASPKFSKLKSSKEEIGEVKFIAVRGKDLPISKQFRIVNYGFDFGVKVISTRSFKNVVYTITGDFNFARKDAKDKTKKITTTLTGAKIAYADDYASATVTYDKITEPGAYSIVKKLGFRTLFDKIYIEGTSETPFDASDYSVTVAYELQVIKEVTDIVVDSFNKQSPSAGAFASVVREGTTLIFPWVSSATQGASSGSTNIIRIGNPTSSPLGTVSARVKTSNKSGFVITPRTKNLVASVPANGEFVITSKTLQDKLGDWGRGDIEVIIEEDSKSITANRLIANGSLIVNVDAGRADKYNDE